MSCSLDYSALFGRPKCEWTPPLQYCIQSRSGPLFDRKVHGVTGFGMSKELNGATDAMAPHWRAAETGTAAQALPHASFLFRQRSGRGSVCKPVENNKNEQGRLPAQRSIETSLETESGAMTLTVLALRSRVAAMSRLTISSAPGAANGPSSNHTSEGSASALTVCGLGHPPAHSVLSIVAVLLGVFCC